MQEKTVEGYRLSFHQKRLWPLRDACRAQGAIMLTGRLNREALRQALERVVLRHEILRTTFHQLPGMDFPLQVIENGAPLSFREIDLGHFNPEQQGARIEELFREEGYLPFKFHQSPLVRFSLVVLSPDKHVLLLSLPSLNADAQTLGNLVSEISRCYAASLLGEVLTDDTVQYVDFAEWQRTLLQAEDPEQRVEYWRKEKRLPWPAVTLPFEKQVEQRRFVPESLALALDPDLARRIDLLAYAYQVRVASLLLACWQTVLWRLTDQPDIVTGYLCDGRKFEPLREALGLFAQYLPVSCHFEEEIQFDQVVRRVNDMACAAYEYQEFYNLEHSIGGAGNSANDSSFPVAFEFEEWPQQQLAGGVEFSLCNRYICTGGFKLKLSAMRRRDALTLAINFDPAFYSEDVIERLLEQLHTLLNEVVSHPEIRIGEADVLGKTERHQVLVNWNETSADYPREMAVHDLFEAQVEKTPDTIAVVMEQEHLSYSELNRRANQLARYLRRLGIGCESIVGLLMERSTQMIEGLWGILKAGAVYAPMDPAQPIQRLQFIVEDGGISTLVTQQQLAASQSVRGVKIVCLDSDRETVDRESEGNLGVKLSSDNLAYVIYTSGSTGKPKGVLVRQGSVVNYAMELERIVYERNLGRHLRVSLNAPLVFDASVKQMLHLLFGHRLVVIPEEARRDGKQMISYLGRQQIDVVDCTPTHLQMLQAAGFGKEANLVPEWGLVGGETLGEELWAELAASTETRYFNHYGPTECTVNTTMTGVHRATQGPTIGRPIANAQIFLLDAYLKPVPIGVPGELHIGGAGLARGYLNRPEWTAERFIPNPFGSEIGQRLYRSGDLARYWPDATLEFLGRVDHQVKVRGHRVELGEVESVLKEHSAVREAVVLAWDGNGGKRLVAYVVPFKSKGDSAAAAGDGLRAFLRERLPDYMVPSAFVEVDELPLTRNGKLDRQALPAPEQEQAEAEEKLEGAVNLVEELLTGICAELLHLEHVGQGDNFFDLGGHSLLATQLISRVREAFNVEIPLRSLFETSTMAELAERIKKAIGDGHEVETPPIKPVDREKPLPLSLAQQRLWFLDQLAPGNPAYSSARPTHLEGCLSVAGLEQAFGEIVRRHEILRTMFPTVGEQPVQVITPPQPQLLPIVDLSGLSEAEQTVQSRRLLVDESQRDFDLTRLPLLRTTLLRLGKRAHTVLFAVHHIIIDGWSMSIFGRETTGLYEAFSAGKPSLLPELPIQYGDFAHWQREWLQGEVLEAQLSYWTQHLAGTTELDLPARGTGLAGQTFRGAIQPLLIAAELSGALRELSRREGVTLFMTLMAAFKTLLYLYTGQLDIVVGTGIAGRGRAEVERLIGFFINMLALRTDLSGNPSFRELLKRVREVTLAGYLHQDLPFDRLVAELRPQWTGSRTSLFQAVFFLQNFPTSTIELPDLTSSSVGHDPGIAHFDLMLFLTETQQGLIGGVEYNTDLFDAAIIGQMSSDFESLLAKIVSSPEVRLLEITLGQEQLETETQSIPCFAPDEREQFNFWL